MFLFWFLVVLSVYFEIFCYKICLGAEKMAKKKCKICRKIAFSECYQTSEIVFWTIFHWKTKYPDFIFLTRIHFALHSFYTRISFSLREFTLPCIHFTLEIWFTLNQTQPKTFLVLRHTREWKIRFSLGRCSLGCYNHWKLLYSKWVKISYKFT